MARGTSRPVLYVEEHLTRYFGVEKMAFQEKLAMTTSQHLSKWSLFLFACMFALQTSAARADMVPTDKVLSPDKISADRDKVRAFMDRADAQEKLRALGVQADEAKARVDALTDAQVEAIAGRIDKLPAGGNLGKSDIIIILLIAILVAIAL
jgi:hypothetical protein